MQSVRCTCALTSIALWNSVAASSKRPRFFSYSAHCRRKRLLTPRRAPACQAASAAASRLWKACSSASASWHSSDPSSSESGGHTALCDCFEQPQGAGQQQANARTNAMCQAAGRTFASGAALEVHLRLVYPPLLLRCQAQRVAHEAVVRGQLSQPVQAGSSLGGTTPPLQLLIAGVQCHHIFRQLATLHLDSAAGHRKSASDMWAKTMHMQLPEKVSCDQTAIIAVCFVLYTNQS